MQDLMNSLFNETSSIGVIPESDYHNHIINEAIILDMVNGDTNALQKVMTEAGAYAARDNLLENATPVMDAIKCFNQEKTHSCAAVLATAKEANDPEYELLVKAHLLSKALMKSLKEKYAAQAAARVDHCRAELQNNSRIMTAVDNAKPVAVQL
jgi:hypothetical protein